VPPATWPASVVLEPAVFVRTVSGVVAVDHAGQVLLVHRTDDQTWDLPRGGVEAATPRRCAGRSAARAIGMIPPGHSGESDVTMPNAGGGRLPVVASVPRSPHLPDDLLHVAATVLRALEQRLDVPGQDPAP
jgi:hypothetical protein